jgi:hypothetical protein
MQRAFMIALFVAGSCQVVSGAVDIRSSKHRRLRKASELGTQTTQVKKKAQQMKTDFQLAKVKALEGHSEEAARYLSPNLAERTSAIDRMNANLNNRYPGIRWPM